MDSISNYPPIYISFLSSLLHLGGPRRPGYLFLALIKRKGILEPTLKGRAFPIDIETFVPKTITSACLVG
jgi:hypothetical protein